MPRRAFRKKIDARKKSRDSKPAKRAGRGPKPAKGAARPRTFEEVLAANLQDPFHSARLARLASGERFVDPTASDPSTGEVSVHPDCEGGSHWLVEWGDDDGGCYVTTFDGPLAERRARDYFEALRSGQLKPPRE
jgi:hypothetical protein